MLASILAAQMIAAQPVPAKAADPVAFPTIVAAAVSDARSSGLPGNVRYLSAAHLSPAGRRALYDVISVHVNLLSRGPDRVAPRKVNEWLWAVDISDYQWNAKVWEDLKRVNHYFCIKVQVPAKAAVVEKVKKTRQVQRYDARGQSYYVNEEYTEDVVKAAAADKVEDFIPAPWLPTDGAAELLKLTGSVTPIVRADLFLFETAAQVGRAGHGYYDWLEVKARKDAEKIATLDRKVAEERFRELGAIMKRSGVSPNNRQVFWYRTVGGSWWESRDVFTSTGNKNAVVNLLDDYKHDAEEIVFTLPNRLPGFYLSDKDGKQVDSAPDGIATDKKTTNNDARVHVCYACVVCHEDAGLKPLNDYARRKYNPDKGNSLAVLDPEKAKRLKSVYLGPLQDEYESDVKTYTKYINELSGLKPQAFSQAYQKQWSRYIDEPVTIDAAAAECGVTTAQLTAALRRYAKTNKVVNAALSDLIEDEPDPMRREHWEEVFPLAMLILGGLNP